MKKKSKEIHWCPTQNGSYTAYVPEYLDYGIWLKVPVKLGKDGTPQPFLFGNINSVIRLYGYEQAQSLAWGYAALKAADFNTRPPKVRVQTYEVFYDIKARKIPNGKETP